MKSKKPVKPRRYAEGGPTTNAEHQRTIPRQMGQKTAGLGELNRRLGGYPQQNRSVEDSPSTMAKNRAAAAKPKRR